MYQSTIWLKSAKWDTCTLTYFGFKYLFDFSCVYATDIWTFVFTYHLAALSVSVMHVLIVEDSKGYRENVHFKPFKISPAVSKQRTWSNSEVCRQYHFRHRNPWWLHYIPHISNFPQIVLNLCLFLKQPNLPHILSKESSKSEKTMSAQFLSQLMNNLKSMRIHISANVDASRLLS